MQLGMRVFHSHSKLLSYLLSVVSGTYFPCSYFRCLSHFVLLSKGQVVTPSFIKMSI